MDANYIADIPKSPAYVIDGPTVPQIRAIFKFKVTDSKIETSGGDLFDDRARVVIAALSIYRFVGTRLSK